ncbi:MAG: hypothetical protein ACXWQO_18905 [Bdellovibrionota bacterium]
MKSRILLSMLAISLPLAAHADPSLCDKKMANAAAFTFAQDKGISLNTVAIRSLRSGMWTRMASDNSGSATVEVKKSGENTSQAYTVRVKEIGSSQDCSIKSVAAGAVKTLIAERSGAALKLAAHRFNIPLTEDSALTSEYLTVLDALEAIDAKYPAVLGADTVEISDEGKASANDPLTLKYLRNWGDCLAGCKLLLSAGAVSRLPAESLDRLVPKPRSDYPESCAGR